MASVRSPRNRSPRRVHSVSRSSLRAGDGSQQRTAQHTPADRPPAVRMRRHALGVPGSHRAAGARMHAPPLPRHAGFAGGCSAHLCRLAMWCPPPCPCSSREAVCISRHVLESGWAAAWFHPWQGEPVGGTLTSWPMVTATHRPAMAASALMTSQCCSRGISSSTCAAAHAPAPGGCRA